MNEQKNNLETESPENLDYSFDFTNQVEPEKTEVQETLTVDPIPAEPQMVDVSVPVMEEAVSDTNITVASSEPVQQPAIAPVMDQPVVSEPVVENVQETVTVETPAVGEQLDVSVPVMDQNVGETPEQVTVAEQTESIEQTEEIKDGKSTLRFVIILVIIIVAFIIALPFALDLLGY